jgi:DNA ligase (NAD+)
MYKKNILSLIDKLNKATEAYDSGNPYMKDTAWDSMYFELVRLEEESGLIFPHSPTQTIHYNIMNKLEKVTHSHPMLSLAKTKSEKEIYDFIGGKEYITMLKMDGLTCSLTYKNGKLVAAETRGNGTVGENILHNALILPSIPKSIGIKDELIVDGEIISTYTNFKDWADKYANPRNFAAGSIRLLDSKECAERGLTFVAWDRINAPEKTMAETLVLLDSLGFEVVPYLLNEFNIEALKTTATICNYPIDGLVVKYNNRDYGESLGRTSHHFNNGIAFKFADDSVTSYLKEIDYEVSRNGILTPVAVFEEVELEGSTVSRASLHNMSMMYKILGHPYVGQEIEIVKQNMIIPQVVSSVKRKDDERDEKSILTPGYCPSCMEPLEIQCENESEVLACTNLNCSCRIINKLDYFCSKKGLDIKGLSKATLEKLLAWGWIEKISDLFTLESHRTEWTRKPGFGPKSVDKVLSAIEASRKCSFEKYLAAWGIPLIGPAVVKELGKTFDSWTSFIEAVECGFNFYDLKGFGYEMHKAIIHFDYEEAKYIAENYIDFSASEMKKEEVEQVTPNDLAPNLCGKTFVITGKLVNFKNRTELVNLIEKSGGKVATSVSGNTSYLINNDKDSASSKNREAKTRNIPIITEEEFLQTFGLFT